ncbi:hypothetical protein RB195_005150 [Necator americanus]|uniref:Uncharacterized protein n=1 Tax=Necator americanus TaxID=51031 RepID=A0ABR1BLF4_NECAM
MRTFASDERTLREENADGLDDEEMSRQWSDGEIYGRVTCNIDTTKSLGTAMVSLFREISGMVNGMSNNQRQSLHETTPRSRLEVELLRDNAGPQTAKTTRKFLDVSTSSPSRRSTPDPATSIITCFEHCGSICVKKNTKTTIISTTHYELDDFLS